MDKKFHNYDIYLSFQFCIPQSNQEAMLNNVPLNFYLILSQYGNTTPKIKETKPSNIYAKNVIFLRTITNIFSEILCCDLQVS